MTNADSAGDWNLAVLRELNVRLSGLLSNPDPERKEWQDKLLDISDILEDTLTALNENTLSSEIPTVTTSELIKALGAFKPDTAIQIVDEEGNIFKIQTIENHESYNRIFMTLEYYDGPN